MALNIIGISAYFHDSSCCLLRDGELVAAVSEERLTRVKHDASLPRYAFRSCLEQGGITIDQVDCVAYYEDPVKKLARQLWMGLPGIPASRLASDRWFDTGRAEREIREVLGFEKKILFFEHHLSHAASSFFFSGFTDAAILTVDGVGEWATTSYGRGHGERIELFEQVEFPDSLGLLYSTITGYLGFEVNEGEYKVMGLAPYGQPRYADRIRALVRTTADGGFHLEMEYFDFLRGDRMHSDKLIELLGEPARHSDSDILPFHEDMAASLQVVLEEILLEKVSYLHRQVPSNNLCMAGGVALNCVANGKILAKGPFEHLFVQPAASDAGSALGAAALAHVACGGSMPRTRLQHVYLGRTSEPERVRTALRASAAQYLDFGGDEEGLARAVADRLEAGKVIGWYQGREEFGPRALGARSILADPRRVEMRDRVNALVKMREAFRPFAPAILESRVHEHFTLDHASPFMLETCQVHSPIALPAITHVDGSARVQTVSPAVSPRFARLLEAFERRTGCPILLNTSFNMRGEPIVSTFIDAIRCFVRTEIDCLVLHDLVLDREHIPTDWYQMNQLPAARMSNVGDRIYTFF